MAGDFDDDWFPETKDYRMGTASIYSGPKHPKPKTATYGYKFVETDTMKTRRHHNNKGLRQIKRGKTRSFAKKLARKYVTR